MIRPRSIRPSHLDQPAFHARLADFNRERLSPALATSSDVDFNAEVAHRRAELQWVEQERRAVAADTAGAPTDVDGFMRWFEDLESTGPGQHDPLFSWLAQEATLDDMRWFLKQEIGGEAGFEDLVALTQVKMPATAKLELARNYWDELGQGHPSGMHGPMLDALARELRLDEIRSQPVWEALALGNMMIALAANRGYAYQSIGALGVIELTAPGRATLVNAGLKRLGIDGAARRYYALHATLDVKHSAAWNREVIAPLVAEKPEVARAIAEGALLRLRAGARCFERYRSELAVRQREAS